MMYQTQIALGSLPVNLVLVGNKENAGVCFVQVMPFASTVFDLDNDGNIRAMFSPDEFVLFSDKDSQEVFQYGTVYDYKTIPAMLEWLQGQNLQQPE